MPTVLVLCPHCSRRYDLDGQWVGRRARCRQCGRSFSVTPSSAAGLGSQPPAWAGMASQGGPGSSDADRDPRAPGSDSAAGSLHPRDDLPEQFGRYRIERLLGRGGMGAVYLAHDSQLDRQVALKVPHFTPGAGPQALDRFYREARAAATFDHPNLCPVYDVGQVDGTPYLTMPYLQGKPLSEAIEPDHPTPPRQAAAVVRKLALAMEVAHRRGVIHRDLKPSNIMTSRHRELVIMDFGLARRDEAGDARLTQAGAPLGTPAYMAPEQARGDAAAIGPATDIYSLGVILYEMLTGRVPFEGPPSLVLGLIVVAQPRPPSQRCAGLDAALEAICLKAMAKEMGERYATMAEFAAVLEGYLASGSRPPSSQPPSGFSLPIRIEEEGDRIARESGAGRVLPRPVAAGAPVHRRPLPPRRLVLALAGAAALLGLGVVLFVARGRGTTPTQVEAPSAPPRAGGKPVARPPAVPAPVTLTFQQGVDGYAGAWGLGYLASVGPRPGVPSLWVDWPEPGSSDPLQQGAIALLRFDGLFGPGAGRVPPGSTIRSARLRVVTGPGGEGNGATVHRLKKPIEFPDVVHRLLQDAEGDRFEVFAPRTALLGSPSRPAGSGAFELDVTADVRAWASGADNHGWAFLPWPDGRDGWGFCSPDFPDVADRPSLVITYIPPTIDN